MDRERAGVWLAAYRRPGRRPTPPTPPTAPTPCARPLIGCSILTFTPDGLVATGRDYRFLEPGTHPPSEGWGG